MRNKAFSGWRADLPPPIRDRVNDKFLGPYLTHISVTFILPKESLQLIARFFYKTSKVGFRDHPVDSCLKYHLSRYQIFWCFGDQKILVFLNIIWIRLVFACKIFLMKYFGPIKILEFNRKFLHNP